MDPTLNKEALLRNVIPSIIEGVYGKNVNYTVDINIINDSDDFINMFMLTPTRANDRGQREVVEEKRLAKKRKNASPPSSGQKEKRLCLTESSSSSSSSDETSESDDAIENANSNRKRKYRQSVKGFSYDRFYKGKKKYVCNACGKSNIDSRYTDTHRCLR